MAPAKCDGKKLGGDDAHGGKAHQRFYGVGLGILSAPDLYGLDAAAFLSDLLNEIDPVKHRQNE